MEAQSGSLKNIRPHEKAYFTGSKSVLDILDNDPSNKNPEFLI
jgi:hypothetical protein